MKVVFAPGWKMSFFVLIFFPGLILLGQWQLERAELKRSLEMNYLHHLTQLPVSVQDLNSDFSFQRVKLAGKFLPQKFFLDNQVHDGDVGYWLVQVFSTVQGQKLLLNRGFVVAPATRRDLPVVDTPKETLQIVGVIWPHTGLVPLLVEDTWDSPGDGPWSRRIQRMDVTKMAKFAQTQPLELRLEPGQPGVLQAAPFAAALSDGRHMGYAATWFGLAVVLTVGYLAFGLFQGRVGHKH